MARRQQANEERGIDVFENVNIDSNVAVYAQIENHVQFAIAAGKLQPGDKLPPVRELSEKLGVNPNTVAKSYRDLEVMGYVYTRQGMGVFIEKGIEQKCKEQCLRRIISNLHEVVAEGKAAGLSHDEIKEYVAKCYQSEAGPYSPVPDAVLALAKQKKRAKS